MTDQIEEKIEEKQDDFAAFSDAYKIINERHDVEGYLQLTIEVDNHVCVVQNKMVKDRESVLATAARTAQEIRKNKAQVQ